MNLTDENFLSPQTFFSLIRFANFFTAGTNGTNILFRFLADILLYLIVFLQCSTNEFGRSSYAIGCYFAGNRFLDRFRCQRFPKSEERQCGKCDRTQWCQGTDGCCDGTAEQYDTNGTQ